MARTLRDDPALRFEICTGVSGVHYPDLTGSEMHAVYHLLSITHNRRVRLEVAEENLPAMRLYERHGFTRDGTTWDNPLYGGIREIGYAVRVDPGCRPSARSGTVDP